MTTTTTSSKQQPTTADHYRRTVASLVERYRAALVNTTDADSRAHLLSELVDDCLDGENRMTDEEIIASASPEARAAAESLDLPADDWTPSDITSDSRDAFWCLRTDVARAICSLGLPSLPDVAPAY